MKNFIFKFGGAIAGLALIITTLNLHTNCMYLVHQPKLPKGIEKLRKV